MRGRYISIVEVTWLTGAARKEIRLGFAFLLLGSWKEDVVED